MFIENGEKTLDSLISERLHTNRLFLIEDVEKLIQSVVYTLANLQSKGFSYKDVNSQFIFRVNGNFKLLPPELINKTAYERMLGYCHFVYKNQEDSEEENETKFICASPEMILAMRHAQEDIFDDEIIEKSNVFAFGMILLEATTLRPSFECYDQENYDILDEIIR